MLDIEEDYDFGLIGISCHGKDYRLCWELNNRLSIDLKRSQDLVIDNSTFSFYEYFAETDHIEYFFISNRGEQRYLVPEQRKVDYFFVIRGPLFDDLTKDIIWKINSISLVLTSFNIDPNQLKSKENLLF